jgi:hypothetical protein
MKTKLVQHEIGWVSWMTYTRELALAVVDKWNLNTAVEYALLPALEGYKVTRIK